MGGGLVLEIGSQICKFVMILMKTCCKSVGNHPFVVGFLLFFIFLHRSFPALFSVLVSTSPVLVCTAVLLGTLLSFGQSNIPEIERQEDLAPLRTWVPGDDTLVVESGGSFSAEKFSAATSRDIVNDDASPGLTDYRDNVEVGDHDVYAPLIDENVLETESNKRVIEDVDRDIELETRGLPNDAEAVEQHYTLLQQVRDQIIQVQDDNVSPRGGEHLDSFLGGYGHDESGEASDSGSDGAESSSPDASMADILPILDELHPLLDSEAPQPAHMSHDGSDAASDSSVESDEDIEDHGGQVDEDDGVDYHGGDEEEVQAHGGTEDESKSAIKWTDDDQKNLMDLGTLELERNRRLENLIARRRARKSFKLMSEKNLIDFDGVDLPFNVSPISTTRRNPFDSPFDDSYGNMGLPPIPGSAPSIMLARRNPFDLPYDSNEEKPDLKGDHFEQEFIASHANDAFFRRHESFSLGTSTLGGAKHERQPFKWKPVFVPERLDSEGPGYSLFQRQLSEVSESKLSSVPDSDSVSSVADLDDRKFSEQDYTTEAEVISNIYQASGLVDHGSHSYGDIHSLEMEQVDNRHVLPNRLDTELGEGEKLEPSLSDNGGLPTLVTNELRSNPQLVEEEDSSHSSSRSSLSSLSDTDEKIQVDNRDVQPNRLDTELGEGGKLEPSLSDNGGLPTLVTNELHSNPLLVEEEDSSHSSSRSSLSSLSDADEKIQVDNRDVQPNRLDTELGEGGKLEPSLSDNGGLPTLVTNELHSNPELVEEEDSSSRSSLSPMSEADEKISDVWKGEKSSEPSGDLIKEFPNSPQHSLEESNVQSISTIVDDNQFNEPVYDSIPLEAENLISLNSISSDMQAEIAELVTLHALAEMHVPIVYKDNYVNSDNIEKATKGDTEIFAATSKEHGADAVEGDLVNYNQPQLTGSLSEVEVGLPRKLEENPTSSESSYHYLLSSEQTSEQEKDLSWLDKSIVEPCLDDHLDALDFEDNVKEEIDDIKEIDAELLLELDTVGDFSVKEVVGEPLHYELIREEANVVSTASGLSTAESNLSEAKQELPIIEHIHEGVNIDGAFEQIHEGVDVEEVRFPNVVDNEQLSESTVQTSSQLLTVESTSLEDIITSSNQAPDIYVNEFPQQLDTRGSAELHFELPPEGSEVSVDVFPAVEDIASDNIGSTVQETFTTHIHSKQQSGYNDTEPPNPSKDVLAEAGTEAVVKTLFGDEETITESPLKQLSEGNVAELPNPSNSKDVMSEIGTESVVETFSSNVVYGVEETIPDSPLKQVSEDAVCELPKPSNLKDGYEEVTTTVGDSIEEIGSNNTGSVVQETNPTHNVLKQVPESIVVETIEIAPGIREVAQEHVPAEVSENNVGVGELPKLSDSNDGLTE